MTTLNDKQKKVMQSTVWYGEHEFFVSTINRESSAVAAHGSWYAETIAWEIVDHKRGRIVASTSSATDSLIGHIRVCRALHAEGQYSEEKCNP